MLKDFGGFAAWSAGGCISQQCSLSSEVGGEVGRADGVLVRLPQPIHQASLLVLLVPFRVLSLLLRICVYAKK